MVSGLGVKVGRSGEIIYSSPSIREKLKDKNMFMNLNLSKYFSRVEKIIVREKMLFKF